MEDEDEVGRATNVLITEMNAERRQWSMIKIITRERESPKRQLMTTGTNTLSRLFLLSVFSIHYTSCLGNDHVNNELKFTG